MNIDLLYHPHHQETLDVHVDSKEYDDVTYTEWCELMEKVEDGRIEYYTWFQDEETGYELKVLCHNYIIKNGVVVSYNQELED